MTLKLKDLEVGDLMTRNVAAVRASEPLSAAAQLLWDRDCGSIPVLEDQGERVVAMVTDRDICMATWSRNAAPSALLVAEAMSPGLVSCGPMDSIDAAERAMRANQVRRLPVLDSERRLVGILSLTDIARVARGRSATRPGFDISPLQVIDTLNMITNGPQKAATHGRVTES